MQVAWNQAHCTMKLSVDEICVAGSSPPWTAVFCDWVAQSQGLVTIVWSTTEVDDQSSLHCVTVSTNVMSDRIDRIDHIGRQDASRGGGCSKTSAYTGQFGSASMIWSILSVAALRHREGGATLLSTGSHESCVGCRQPAAWNQAHWTMKLVVDEICVAG